MIYNFKDLIESGDEKERLCSVFNQLCGSQVAKSLLSKYGESAFDIVLLIGALVLFAKNDAEALFNENKDVDERTMAGCVYRYIFCACLMNLLKSTQPDIDIEYDRMRVVGKGLVSKCFTPCLHPKEMCKSYQNKVCNDFIKNHGKLCDKCEQYEKRIRPDLIIHKRNSEPGSDNGMIVEFKRDDAGGCDDVKITYSTCLSGTLKYKIGAKVTLSSVNQKVELYKDSVKDGEMDVSKEYVSYKEQ